MQITVEPIEDAAAKSSLCAEITAQLPMWFGRPEANASYIRHIADRDVFAASLDGRVCGLIALEIHFAVTCNIWWLGVSPAAHRRGLGRTDGGACPRPRLPPTGRRDHEPACEEP